MAYQAALEALADPTRRTVFERLRGGPRAVVDIAGDLPVSRPAVSQHLKVLKDAGLISSRREGTRNLYRIEAGGLAALRDYLEGFWDEALEAYRDAAERPRGTRRGGST
jgi:DNA-binding transcriptional ArsR family regulator